MLGAEREIFRYVIFSFCKKNNDFMKFEEKNVAAVFFVNTFHDFWGNVSYIMELKNAF